MTRRYLRFTRALALGAGLVGCARVSEEDDATPDADIVLDTGRDAAVTVADTRTPDTYMEPWVEPPVDSSTRDTARDTNVDANEKGTCVSYVGPVVICNALQTCEWTGTGSLPYVECTDGPGVACGVIQCGRECYCTNPATSECKCTGPLPGPLPPPDLPIA